MRLGDIDEKLLDEFTKNFSEVKDLDATSKVKFALRYLLKLKETGHI